MPFLKLLNKINKVDYAKRDCFLTGLLILWIKSLYSTFLKGRVGNECNALLVLSFCIPFSLQALQGRIAALYLPLVSILLENKHRLVKSDEKSPAHAPAPSHPSSIVNGDTGSVKSESKASSISGLTAVSGLTPQAKHRSMISMPQPAEPSKRDSSVFDMIAGTKSKNYHRKSTFLILMLCYDLTAAC